MPGMHSAGSYALVVGLIVLVFVATVVINRRQSFRNRPRTLIPWGFNCFSCAIPALLVILFVVATLFVIAS
jgi:hypothetical protein